MRLRTVIIVIYFSHPIVSFGQGLVDKKSIYEIAHLTRDSIVLSKQLDPSPVFDKIEIFRGQQKIFDYGDLEVIGNPEWLTEHNMGHGEYFYIIRLFNGPEPDKFLIIKTTKIKTTVFGKTESNSSEIFGDVDYDGKFEIGGFRIWCQGGDPKCNPADHYRVFEITDNFPTDKKLTDFFKQSLKKE